VAHDLCDPLLRLAPDRRDETDEVAAVATVAGSARLEAVTEEVKLNV